MRLLEAIDGWKTTAYYQDSQRLCKLEFAMFDRWDLSDRKRHANQISAFDCTSSKVWWLTANN